MEYVDFGSLSSVARLKELAAAPYDLTAKDGLSSSRFMRYQCRNGDFQVLYGTQRIDDEVLDGLQALADETDLVDKFLAMKSGEVINTIIGFESEDRQVLHTACRDVFAPALRAKEAVDQAQAELSKLKKFLGALNDGSIVNSKGELFTTMVQVGIGGSDLGPRALYLALEAFSLDNRCARFIANVDPDDAAAVLRDLDLSRTLFNVVSKSGTTLETLTNEELVRNALISRGLDPARHLVAVTGKGSPMDDPSRYLESFYMYDYIGGRYSATSMVGGVTLGFVLGYDGFNELLQGANIMDMAAEERDIRKNVPLLIALLGVWNHNFLGYPTVAVLPYSQALARFPAHLQQCDMESNGKSITRYGEQVSWQTGPVVWGEPGTNGQHAFYQLLHQGTEIVPAEFIGFRKSQYDADIVVEDTTSQQKLTANMLAQALALAQGMEHDNPGKRFPGNRPSLILMADRLTPRTMGELLALYENKIAFQGFCWDINSFDQEGVQLGKILAKRLLQSMAGGKNKKGGETAAVSVEDSLLEATGMI